MTTKYQNVQNEGYGGVTETNYRASNPTPTRRRSSQQNSFAQPGYYPDPNQGGYPGQQMPQGQYVQPQTYNGYASEQMPAAGQGNVSGGESRASNPTPTRRRSSVEEPGMYQSQYGYDQMQQGGYPQPGGYQQPNQYGQQQYQQPQQRFQQNASSESRASNPTPTRRRNSQPSQGGTMEQYQQPGGYPQQNMYGQQQYQQPQQNYQPGGMSESRASNPTPTRRRSSTQAYQQYGGYDQSSPNRNSIVMPNNQSSYQQPGYMQNPQSVRIQQPAYMQNDQTVRAQSPQMNGYQQPGYMQDMGSVRQQPPQSGYQQPNYQQNQQPSGYQQSGYQQPQAVRQPQPASSYNQSGYQQQQAVRQPQPASSYNQSGYQQPQAVRQPQPASAYNQSGYQQASGYQQPNYQQTAAQPQQPSYQQEKPAAPSVQPAPDNPFAAPAYEPIPASEMPENFGFADQNPLAQRPVPTLQSNGYQPEAPAAPPSRKYEKE